MDIFKAISLLGGLALFIYGMTVMGQGLEKVAGNRMQKIIEALTGNILNGVLVGAAVTAVIQSSSATTVMVVGFVNAGIMSLKQAVGVIMGANIGTTVTALMISLNMIDGSSIFLKLVKPSTLAPIAIVVGVIMMLSSKKKRARHVGEILVGFGVLFTGMYTMESAVSGLRDMPAFRNIFAAFSHNPFLGVLAGCAVTAIIQSSSASIGILQAVAMTGLINFSSAVPIILGQNIGTCVTAVLSGMGATRNAKRAAAIHLYFNIIGTTIFLIGIYGIQSLYPFPFWNNTMTSFDIAKFHILFNVTNTLMQLPFSGGLVHLANITIKGDKAEEFDDISAALDDRFLVTPSVALEQSRQMSADMGRLALENYYRGVSCILEGRPELYAEMEKAEHRIDKMEYKISQYLVKIGNTDLSITESRVSSLLYQMVNDFERIGDHADNLGEIGVALDNDGQCFTEEAKGELSAMFDAVEEIIKTTLAAYEDWSDAIARCVEPLEEVVDMFRDTLKNRHVERLSNNRCTVESGVYYLEIITNLERIADHCSNIAFHVMQRNDPKKKDMHSYLNELHRGGQQEYDAYFKYYRSKFYSRVENL